MSSTETPPTHFRFSLTWLEQVLGPPSVTPKEISGFAEIAHDSRHLSDTSLFIALPGERVDGHTFLESVIQSGVRGVIVSSEWASQNPAFMNLAHSRSVAVYQVKETLAAYRLLAMNWRNRFQIPVICIAGSVGKTTTKELTAAIMQGKFKKTLKTTGSQNGFVGIPMTLLSLTDEHTAAVIEVGIDEPGAMQLHLDVVRPTQAIVTAIGPEHLEKLIDLETVTSEESIALSWTLQAGGRVALPSSDGWIYPYFSKKILTSRNEPSTATYALKDTTPHLPTPTVKGDWSPGTGVLTVIVAPTGTLPSGEFSLQNPLPGKHNALNLLGAVTLALQAGLTPTEIQEGLTQFFHKAYGRSELQSLPNGTQVLCDYYNANPSSVRAGIDTLLELTAQKTPRPRLWVCLADMLELGTDEEQFHRELAQPLLQSGIDRVCLFGDRMQALHHELKSRNLGSHVEHFQTREQLADLLAREVAPGDWVLIKGSRGMKMELVFQLWKDQLGGSNVR